MKEQKDKRVLRIALNDEVKKVSITAKNGEEQVVMRQELNEDDLEQATGGVCPGQIYTIFDDVCESYSFCKTKTW